MVISKNKIKELLKIRRYRYFICKKNIYLFGLYYFTHYFFMKSAPFHKEMAEDVKFKGHKFLFWIMFGESAKTTWAKIKIVHMICYQSDIKKNIGWIGHDLRKASRHVMSIANELKTNKKIIADFGHLFWDDLSTSKINKKSRRKKQSEFMSENDVLVKAISTKISERGEVQDQFRPDFYVIDDIENLKTARSTVVTEATIEFVQEIIRGMAVDCEMLILSNRVAKNGSVAWLEKHLDTNPKALIHEVKIYDKKGKITWPGKFVETTKQADKLNKSISNPKRHFVSLEQKRHDLGTNGFNREMMNEPVDFALAPFKLEWMKRGPCPDLETMDLIVAVDPAIGEKKTNDFFAVCVAGRHRETGVIYIFRLYKTRCGITKQVPLMVNFHVAYPKAKQRIETVAFQKALAQLLEAEKKNGHYIEVEEYKPVDDKILRAHAVAPFVERGDVVFCLGREIDDLVKNMSDFPVTDDGHDDDVDACMSAIEHFIMKKRIPGLAVAS
jgi:predicted phage terminase large subunit-like protein